MLQSWSCKQKQEFYKMYFNFIPDKRIFQKKMIAKDKKIILKTLHSKIITLKEDLN